VGKRILVKDEIDNPERNGIYRITKINDDLTMNLVRDDDFSTPANMLYGTQVTVANNGSTYANQTFFMAAPNVTTVNGDGANPVHWMLDKDNPNVKLLVDNAAVTAVTQGIDINATNGFIGTTTIASTNAVDFQGSVKLQDLQANVQESKTLSIDSTAMTGTGMVFSGIISEADGGGGVTDDVLSLLKIGAGTATLSGANTYSGGTTVQAGTLLVNNITGSGTGSGSVTVQGGAVLGGTGIIAPTQTGANITIYGGDGLDDPYNPDGKLVVGNPGSAGTLGINLQTGSSLLLAGSLLMDIFARPDVNPLTQEADLLDFGPAGTVNLTGSTLKLGTVGVSSTTFVANDTWKLIDWSGITRVGTFSNLTGGNYIQSNADLPTLSDLSLYWDISNLYTTGHITVAVPEPGRLLLLIMSLLALGLRRRRRGWA
jgi:autotransporter-associated beta strand protein